MHTVEFYYPSVGGAQEVVKQISERLAKLGHDVTVATSKLPDRKSLLYNGVKIVEFDIAGKEVLGYLGKDIRRYKNFLKDSDFDIVMNYAAQQWATDLTFEVLDDVRARKVLAPCGFSGLFDPIYKNYFKKMPKIMSSYDAIVYLSDNYRDVDFARKHKINNNFLIPNGAGADEFSKAINPSIRKKFGIADGAFLALLVGSHTGAKGHIEAIEIFEKAKIQNAVLLIIANDFGDDGCSKLCKRKSKLSKVLPRYVKFRKRLIVKSMTREDTITAYKEADIFLFPSNIEASPLVLFEAMASGLPFLTTDVGNSKEIINWSGGGALLPTTKDGSGISRADIEGSVSLLENWYAKPKKASLGVSGHKAWQSKFTWEKIAQDYEKLYQGVLKK